MVKTIEGDIFIVPTQVIVHQCNCFNTMGAGIAAKISSLFPDVYKYDCKTLKGSKDKLGTFELVPVRLDRNRTLIAVCNLYGQYKYGRNGKFTSYDAIYVGLASLKDFLENENIINVSIPEKMGCVLGGGSTGIMHAIYHEIFDTGYVNLQIIKQI